MSCRVSVLMTAYNPGIFFEPAIRSILSQTYTDFELILIEDGSVDGSKEIARQFASIDQRIRLIDLSQNIGRTPALNMALDLAQGEYVAVLDADDLTPVYRLAKQVEFLDCHQSVLLVAGAIRFIDPDGEVISNFSPPTDLQALYDLLAYSNPIAHSSCMYRRRDAIAVGGYPPSYIFAQDFGLWLALIRHGEVAIMSDYLCDIREHANRMTRSARISYNRLYEELELIKISSNFPLVSQSARRRGRAACASLHYRLGKQWLLDYSLLRAFGHFILCVKTAPLYVLKKSINSNYCIDDFS